MAQNIYNKNYLLGLDVVTYLLTDKLPEIGKPYDCTFTRTGEWDGLLVELAPKQRPKQSTLVFRGASFNLHYTDRGTYRLAWRHPESVDDDELINHLTIAVDEINALLDAIYDAHGCFGFSRVSGKAYKGEGYE